MSDGFTHLVSEEELRLRAVVKALCERIGYGAVMDSAARQWFLKDSVGALTVGPCAGLIRDAQ